MTKLNKEEDHQRDKQLTIKRRGGVRPGAGRKHKIVKFITNFLSPDVPQKVIIPETLKLLPKALENIKMCLNSEDEGIRFQASKWLMEYILKMSNKKKEEEKTPLEVELAFSQQNKRYEPEELKEDKEDEEQNNP